MIKAVSSCWSSLPVANGTCPADADVVIIGGGIIGVSTAYFLSRKGISVTLCEKGHIAGEQSSRNWGWVRKQGRAPEELPMMIRSAEIWRELAAEIGDEIGFQQAGCIYPAKTEKDMARFGIGPGAGEAVAKLVSNADPGVDLSPFRLSRFSDGSKLELGPTM
jgi:glycine/D-amino acid oxidase-like deaminating enzyme